MPCGIHCVAHNTHCTTVAYRGIPLRYSGRHRVADIERPTSKRPTSSGHSKAESGGKQPNSGHSGAANIERPNMRLIMRIHNFYVTTNCLVMMVNQKEHACMQCFRNGNEYCTLGCR